MEKPSRAPFRKSTVRVDDLLYRVRWALIVLTIPVAWLDYGAPPIGFRFATWLTCAVTINLFIAVMLQFPDLVKRLPLLSIILDTLLFALLPFTIVSTTNFLAYFAIFPVITATVRFSLRVGIVVVVLLAVAVGAQYFLFIDEPGQRPIITSILPIAAICGVAILTGFISQPIRAEAIQHATQELDKLRGAMADAKLFYETTDLMNLTTNYKPVLETMLDAGVRGLPQARQEDGLPVGMALLFDDKDAEQRLTIIASRNLERRDEAVRFAGKAGVIGEAFQTGDMVVFDRADQDPELEQLGALANCRGGVCFPLRAGMDLYGAVVLASPAPRRPSTEHLQLMQAFTSQAGIALQNAKLYQVSRKEQERIVHDESDMRQKLARDLHDGPTQKLAALVMQMDYINRLLDANPKEARAELEKARGVAQQAVQEIRTALFTLRPLVLETKGLSAAIEQFGARLRDNEKLAIQVEPGPFGPELDTNVAVTVFAIIEEAIGNARKHAAHTPIFVSLQQKENTLVAVVQDQGPGFDVEKVESNYAQRASLGLQNMRERAKLIDGTLTILSAPGQGTRVTLACPIPPPQLTGQPS